VPWCCLQVLAQPAQSLHKTLSTGDHGLVVLDAPAVRADHIKEAWLLGEQEGYEVVVVRPLTTDPQVWQTGEHSYSGQGANGVKEAVGHAWRLVLGGV